jgi:predicted small secreted protein
MRPRLVRRLLPLVVLAACLELAACVVASGAGGNDGDGGTLDGGRDTRQSDSAPTDAADDAALVDAPAPGDAAPGDAMPSDAAPGDAAQTDAPQTDAAPGDATPSDAAPSDTAQADAAQTDASQQDAQQDAATACTKVPADPGFYTYSLVPTYSLVNPPAVAWHPGGTYALVLNSADKVYRYTSATGAVDEVASLGTRTTWKHVSFTPDGAKAVLLAWDSTASEGRIYVWDHAGGAAAEMSPTQRAAGIYYESLAWSPTGQAKLLGRNNNSSNWIVYLWPFDATTGRGTVFAANTSAGCQDLAWATDQFNVSTVAVVCGINGAEIFYIDGGGNLVEHELNIGNTSRIAGRPQGDYAVAVCWSCNSKLYRFKQGLWDAPYASPVGLGGYQIGFATDGRRALFLGGYQSGKGQVYEYVHDTYPTWDSAGVPLMDVSIANFGSPPYNAGSSVELNDVAWRPGCEQGLIVGGSSTQGYLIEFTVDNGCTCPD